LTRFWTAPKKGSATIRTLLIGDNTFIGVSHLSQERARDRTQKLNVESIVEVICEALASGATGYTFSTHPINSQILEALGTCDDLDQFDLYPVLPYTEGYVRLANEKGMMGLVNEVLSKLSLADKAKLLVEGGFSALRLDPAGMLSTYVDAELKGHLNIKPKNATLRSVLLHEVITDLCLGLQETSILNIFAQHIRDRYNAKPGFVTYNLTRFVKLFQEAGLPLEDVTIMTPFNSIGFQMSPSREACELCLLGLPELDVIAMSIMAGGYLKLEEAINYVRTLTNLSGLAVGISSKEHAHDTFRRLQTITISAQERSKSAKPKSEE
jgi:hypothetical protein